MNGIELERMPQPRSDLSFFHLDLTSDASPNKTSTLQFNSFQDLTGSKIVTKYIEGDKVNNFISDKFIAIDQEFDCVTRINVLILTIGLLLA